MARRLFTAVSIEQTLTGSGSHMLNGKLCVILLSSFRCLEMRKQLVITIDKYEYEFNYENIVFLNTFTAGSRSWACLVLPSGQRLQAWKNLPAP